MATKNVGDNIPKKLSIHERRMEAKRLLANDTFEASFQNTMYKTISISTIMAKIRYAHAQAGILMETGALRDLEKTTFTNSVGKQIIQYICQVPITLRSYSDPDDVYETEITASAIGIEADDKFPAKLYSAATKIFARMEYAISDVSDKEIDIDSVADYDAATTKPTDSYAGTVPKSTFQMTTENAGNDKPAEPVTESKSETPKVETSINQKPMSASEQASEAIRNFKPSSESKLKIRVVPKESIEELKN